jgi:hypothetical protein
MELKLTWWRAIKVVWSIAWRVGIAGMIVFFGVVITLRLLGVPVAKVDAVSDPLGLALSISIYIWAVRSALRQTWSDFRIVLVSVGPPLLTWWRVAKIVWSIAWRVGIVAVIVAFVALITIGLFGISAEKANAALIASDPLGYILSIPVYVWAVRSALRRKWSDFRIALVSHGSPWPPWVEEPKPEQEASI